MKREYVYTVLFTFLLSAFLTTILAGANAYFLPRITRNEELVEKRALLYVLNVPFYDASEIEQMYGDFVQKETRGETAVFVKYDAEGQVEGYAIPFQGAGLWGLIKGYIGLSADQKTLQGLEFTAQNETPGLGSRIEEDWYKEQFRGLPIENRRVVVVDKEGASLIDSITGATATSNAVLGIIENATYEALVRWEGAR